MEPSDVRELTDEDSASEEDEQPERLCGNQLLAAAEIHRRRVADVSNKGKSDDDEPHTETARPPSKKNSELYFDEELFEFIVQQSQLYCVYKNWPDINVTKEEIKVFFGILIVSGYNPMPSKASFWSSSPDLRNEAVCNAMRRDSTTADGTKREGMQWYWNY
ncbi:PiggyBac transposable element-derived protein 2 [Portunus trituberculatus]|uniref:PiggyBac transposable element-derived protein 2 n=1 Tax=Portunus trituberculatus TaxID=210409 RepID=A0A5B7FMJ8_PORTR|nr:PiggyBac transposable element-derived protein 2 [Portunus trituberculatus]